MTEITIPRAWIDGPPCRVPDLAAHELFLAQVHRAPDAIAVRQWSKRLTYRQLAGFAAALARRLENAGAGPASRVGICMRRGPALPASVLGVLMAGGTFVPLDLDQPAQRLRTIVEDAGIEIALVDRAGTERLSGVTARLIACEPDGDTGPVPPVTAGVAPEDPAYIMYTSGSTGRPKGVMVSHRNLAAFATAANQSLGGAAGYRQAAFAAIGFDVSVFEFFAPLVCGASIQLVSEAERADPAQLQRFLQVHQTTRVFLPPVLLPLLDPDRLPALREVIVGGEACDPRQVGRWAVAGVRRFFNWYGPTEATVAVVGIELDGHWDTPLPIGRPLPGSSVYVLDENMAICPPGVAGELFAGGPQVALGYVHVPSEVAGRFVPDPFGTGRLYRTGDLATWDDTGVISFLGRADRQVKINGRRIEPGEIEAVLTGHPGVAQAVADVSGSVIRAYVTPADAPSSEELRAHCAAWLPGHMVPASVTALAYLPLTVNAKLDLVALRRLGHAEVVSAPVGEPQTELERTVADQWAAVFETARPDIDADFFLAGGNSLRAMRLASALRGSTSLQITVEDVFAGRTVGGIAARLGSADADTGTALPAGSAAALSPAQRRLWFVEQFAPGVPVHNIVLAEQITGALDVAVLAAAFGHVSGRQTALRWQLRPGDGLPEVTVADPGRAGSPIVRVEDLSALDPQDRRSALDGVLKDEAREPVSLIGGPLWRIRLVRLTEHEHVLVITLHHIIFDGWSQAVLYEELGQAYRHLLAGPAEQPLGSAGPPPGRTFADYSAWVLEQEARNGPTDTAWWQRHLADAPTVLDLPRDRPRPAVLSFSGERRGVPVDPALAAGIARLAAAEGTTVGAVMLAAFGVLVSRLTGERDLVVGVPVADREHAEFERLVGFFIRTLPLRLKVDDHATYAEHIQQASAELASARQHADAPLERVIEALGVSRDLFRNPLFQVMFNVYNFAEARLELGAATGRPLQAGVPGSLVDLTLYVILRDDGMSLEVVYNRNLYDGARVDALLDSYAHLLRALVPDPAQRAGAVSIRPGTPPLPDWQAPLASRVPDTPGLIEQVQMVARDAGDQVAVEDPVQTLSYRDVLRIGERTAAALRAVAVREGDAVAVLAERTAILPAVLLGVLGVGARWAVLDRELPAQVLDRRLTAIRPRAMIYCGPGQYPVPVIDYPAPVIDAADLAGPGSGDPGAVTPAAARGYLSFTSGTTGQPKAVDSGEAPLIHFLNWYRTTFRLGREDRFAMLNNVSHDPVLRDIFTPLTCSGSLTVPDPALLRDPRGLLTWLDDRGITVAHMTPQLVRMMAAGPERPRAAGSLRLVAVAGDQLTEADVAALRRFAPRARLLNFYGTTETPQAQAYHEICGPTPAAGQDVLPEPRAMLVPVGAGIDAAQLLVMSVCGRPAAVGELGEVVIRSRYLSRGYLDRDLDGERFGPLPGAGQGRTYRTGDLGRYGPSGAVTLAGRADDQVKVRGFRVELGEVEAVLRTHPEVTHAAVRLFEHDGFSALHAYVTATAPVIVESDVLRHVRSRLPAYAVPSSVMLLPALPLTVSGKVDRRMLPPPRSALRAGPTADDGPSGEIERLILAIWRDVLGLARIAVNDSFFEIGGHSIAIIAVQARLQRALGRPVPVVDLFRFPTIHSLGRYLAGRDTRADLLDADARGRLRRQRAGRSRAHSRRGDMDQ